MLDPLIRKEMPEGWIDLSIGEATTIRKIFESVYGTNYGVSNVDPSMLEYQHPSGYKPLVKKLEDRHGSRVIITCGAKQGLCASFFALRENGNRVTGTRVPYWCQLPLAAKSEGIKLVGIDELVKIYWKRDRSPFDSYLSVSPNNPDGLIENDKFIDALNEANIPVIHDAAYNTKSYTYFNQDIKSDIQIYSFSKMFGLSGLRVGYCVVKNDDFYDDMLNYIETKTVGVSSLSQRFIYDILSRDDELEKIFHVRSRIEIGKAFKEFERIKNILEPRHMHHGMFGWFLNKGNVDFDSLKIKVSDGKYYGSPGYVRINMAAGLDVIKNVVSMIESKYHNE